MPNDKLGIALHETWKIWGLRMGKCPYEEYFPMLEELCILKVKNASDFIMVWELACHFLHLC